MESHPPQTKQLFYINPVAASRLTNATAKVRFFQNHCLPFDRWMHPIAYCSHAVAVFQRFVSATVAALRFHGNLSSCRWQSGSVRKHWNGKKDFVNVMLTQIWLSIFPSFLTVSFCAFSFLEQMLVLIWASLTAKDLFLIIFIYKESYRDGKLKNRFSDRSLNINPQSQQQFDQSFPCSISSNCVRGLSGAPLQTLPLTHPFLSL